MIVRPPIASALLGARAHLRAMGHDAATRALANATASLPVRLTCTMWDGTFATRRGTADEPGSGRPWSGSLAEYVAVLESYAPEIHRKGTGLAISHGRSRFGGSSDVECVERWALFCDADGVGAADRIERVLRDLGVAFVLQRRPGTDRWHIELPLAEPLVPVAEDEADVATWKHTRYMPELGHVLGVLSELAELACDDDSPSIAKLGFDASCSRLLQLAYPYCRRAPGDAVPSTTWNAGRALVWNRVLLGFAYRAEAYASRVHHAGPDDGAWSRAFAHDGLIRFPLRGGRGYAVVCAWDSGHTTRAPSRRDSSTVLFADGTWFCSHASCGGRGNVDVFESLSQGAQRIIVEGMEESARANPSAAFAPYVLAYAARASGDEVRKLAEALRRAGVDVRKWARAVLRRGKVAA